MKTVNGKVAAITGAASGIGAALARALSAAGCNLALCDIDEAALAHTGERCRSAGVRVKTTRVDVSDRQAVHAWADQVAAEFGRVNIVVNNAGVELAGRVEDLTPEDFAWLMGVNFWGVVHGTQAFLPHLRASG